MELETGSGLSLLCRVGACVCALPAAHVVETMRPMAIEPIAGAPAFVLGLSVVRGRALPVVSAARLLAREGDATIGQRFVVLRAGARLAALVVDEVLGVRTLDTAGVGTLPPLLEGAAEGAIERVASLDAELLLVLRAGCVVPASVWAAIAEVTR